MDLDGTLYSAGKTIPGAVEAIDALRAAGYALRFCTNTDSKPDEIILGELREYGLDVRPVELFTPVVAVRRLLAAHPRPNAELLVSKAVRKVLVPFSADGPRTHVVVADCRDTLDYATLDSAFRAVRAGAELVALQRGRYFTRADGDHIDTGAIVAAVEFATGVGARVLGKPSRDYFDIVASTAGASPRQVMVVGDDATTDIVMGLEAGARTVQVSTGKYAHQVLEGLAGGAESIIGSVANLPELLGLVRRPSAG